MSKRSRRNRPAEPAASRASRSDPAARPEPGPRSRSPSGTSRAGRRRGAVRPYDEAPFYERLRTPLLIAFSGIGVALLGFLFVTQASARPWVCETLLAPPPTVTSQSGPSEPATSPRASPTDQESPAPSPTPARELGFPTQDMGTQHVRVGQELRYAFCPPTSGPHYSAAGQGPISRGFHTAGVSSPGGWVHNLEHGWVVVLYSCGADGATCPSDEEMAALREIFDGVPQTETATRCGVPNKVLVARFDEIASRFALVAWNRALLMDEIDTETAIDFAEQWMDSPAAPEAGVC